MDKMTLLVFGETGHVLGAVTRTSQPDVPPDPPEVVGDALILRNGETGETQIRVSADRLKAEVVDRRDQVMLNTRAYVVESGLVEEQDPLNVSLFDNTVPIGSRLLTMSSCPSRGKS